MKKIAIISDTHGLLREEVKEELKNVDLILHAGDINTQSIVEELRSYAPLYIVRGNNDKEWAVEIPQHLFVTVEGVRFFLIHNRKEIPTDLKDVDVIVYGHSHKYEETRVDDILMLNPGSCGKRRFGLEISMVLMEVENGNYCFNKMIICNEM